MICQSCENVCHANFLLRDADKAEAVDEAAREGLDIPEGCQEKVAESEEVEDESPNESFANEGCRARGMRKESAESHERAVTRWALRKMNN